MTATVYVGDEEEDSYLSLDVSKDPRPKDASFSKDKVDDDDDKSANGHRPSPWLPKGFRIDWDRPIDSLNEEIHHFVEYIKPTDAELTMRRNAVARVEQCVKAKWKLAEVVVFGSCSTKLNLPNGDIDIAIMGRWKNVPLWTLARMFEEQNIADDIKVIDRARVPIIKMVERTSRCSMDISFNQPSGAKAAEVIREYLKTYPQLHALSLFIKYFLYQRGINQVFTGGLGSYGVCLTIVSFLQMHPRVTRSESLSHCKNVNIAVYLIEYFELYGINFNYNTVGISCVGSGSYFRKVERGWHCLYRPHLMALEDPLDKSNNVTANSFSILNVRYAYGNAFRLLSSMMVKAYKPKTESFLSEIITISDEIVEAKAHSVRYEIANKDK